MSRGMTSGMKTAIAAGVVYPVLFGRFDFLGGTIYANNSNVSIPWDGHDWTGLGHFVSVQGVNETADISANNVSFTLSGVPSSLLAELFTNRSRGRGCALYLGCFTSAGALIADPQMIFSGRMDQPAINDQGVEASISITAESRLIDLQRPRERRFTDQDQKTYYPTDNFFKFVTGLQDKQILWGTGGTGVVTAGGGGGATNQSFGGGGYNGGANNSNFTVGNNYRGTNSLGQNIDGLGRNGFTNI